MAIASAAGTIDVGGDLTVNRFGFGAMRITGPGIWGPPENKEDAIAVLRRAVEEEINFIDTADSYGPEVSEELIAEALYPYPDDLVIATKAGMYRTGPTTASPTGSGPRTAGRNTSSRPARRRCAGSGSNRFRCSSSTSRIPRCRSKSR